MKCTACGAAIPEAAAYCPGCGTKVGDAADSAASAGPALRAGSRKDEPEEELWSGGYSAKAMLGTFIGAAILSLVLLVGGVFVGPSFQYTWPIVGVVLLLIWVYAIGLLLYRRLNISYRLTSQRFFHQSGLLTRTTDRVEVIQMDDVTYQQTFFERFFGVGTIKITSSDATHPVLIMPGIANVQEVAEIIDKARRKELTRRGLRIETV
jgi:uncharacterized membrane protein YdbT with pleckstrin-like domain